MHQLELVEPKKIKRVDATGARHYLTETGEKYPSVTTVLGQLNRKAIQDWRNRVGHDKANKITKRSAGVGNDLHKMCENHLLMEEQTCNQTNTLKMFGKMEPYLGNISKVYGVELMMWSDRLKLAGASDCIADYNGELSVIDFKNSMKPKKKEWITNYFLQGTAYSNMFYERYGRVPKQIVILIAVWNGPIQEFIVPVKDYYPQLIEVMKEHNPLW